MCTEKCTTHLSAKVLRPRRVGPRTARGLRTHDIEIARCARDIEQNEQLNCSMCS